MLVRIPHAKRVSPAAQRARADGVAGRPAWSATDRALRRLNGDEERHGGRGAAQAGEAERVDQRAVDVSATGRAASGRESSAAGGGEGAAARRRTSGGSQRVGLSMRNHASGAGSAGPQPGRESLPYGAETKRSASTVSGLMR
nr:unnamed protein product [Digitaria exilis]